MADSSSIDSLLLVLQSQETHKERMGTLNQLASDYLKTNPKESYPYCLEVLLLDSEEPHPEERGKALGILAEYYVYLGKFDSAKIHIDLAVEIAQELPDSTHKMRIYSSAVGYALRMGEFEEVKAYANEGGRLAMELNHPGARAVFANALGIVSDHTGKMDEAIFWYQTSKEALRRAHRSECD